MPGTIPYHSNFDAGAVSESLRKAMCGFGTDEKAIIYCLANHSCQQRLDVCRAYKTAYGKDLKDDLKSELTGNFEDVCLFMLTDRRINDVHAIHDAISGAGTDENVLIEILASEDNCGIEEIKFAYKAEYNKDLEEELCKDTSGYFRRFLVSLLAAGRESDECSVDREKARADAQKLYEAGAGQWGTDEAEINALLCLSSPSHLREVFRQYKDIAGKTIEESIQNECSGSLQKGYLAIIECVTDKPTFFARRIRECMDGIGTNEKNLSRLIVSRSEIDLDKIEKAYKKMQGGKTLIDDIKSECSGDYKKMLIAIITMD